MINTSRNSLKSPRSTKQSPTTFRSNPNHNSIVTIVTRAKFRPVSSVGTASCSTPPIQRKAVTVVHQSNKNSLSNSNLASLNANKSNKHNSATNSNMSLNESSRKTSGSSSGLYLSETASTKAKKAEHKQLKESAKDSHQLAVMNRQNSIRKRKANMASSSTISLPCREANNATKSPAKKPSTSVFDRLTRSSRKS